MQLTFRKMIVCFGLWLLFTNVACQKQSDSNLDGYWEKNSIIYRQYAGEDPISAAEAIHQSIELDKIFLKESHEDAYYFGLALSYMRLHCLQKYTDYESAEKPKEKFLKYYQKWSKGDYDQKLAAQYIEEFECAVFLIDMENRVSWWRSLDESIFSRLQEKCSQIFD